jgi:hypothetical protein
MRSDIGFLGIFGYLAEYPGESMMAPLDGTPTRRQRDFLQALIELWRADDAAVHYTDLAEHVGVNRYTAYDMLRVLESKGLAEAHYALGRDNQGAGRSSVYYAPTDAGLLEASLSRGASLSEEWHTFSDFLLGRLRSAHSIGYEQLMGELMEQIPRLRSPLFYCSEVITLLLIHLNKALDTIMGMNGVGALNTLVDESHESSLSLMAGVSLGSGLSHITDRRQMRQLLDYTRRYQQLLQGLGTDGKKLLAGFLQEAMTIMGQSESYTTTDIEGGQHDQDTH